MKKGGRNSKYNIIKPVISDQALITQDEAGLAVDQRRRMDLIIQGLIDNRQVIEESPDEPAPLLRREDFRPRDNLREDNQINEDGREAPGRLRLGDFRPVIRRGLGKIGYNKKRKKHKKTQKNKNKKKKKTQKNTKK